MDACATHSWYCDRHDAVAETLSGLLRVNSLLRGVSRLGLAVSGGADSVALFHLLLPACRERGILVSVLHLNHGLRPEAEQEEAFVRALAASEGVPFLSDALRLAERGAEGLSLEMAARAARQAFFARCCNAARLDAVATGHQADDVAETLLLRLSRGAGCAGLSGLRPRSAASSAHARLAGRPFFIIRPLLAISGPALRAWLLQRGLTWREDASNRDCAIPRNLVRNGLLPALENTWGASLRPNLCRTAEVLREEDDLLERLAARRMTRICHKNGVDAARLLRQPEALRRRILRHWLFSQACPESCGFDSVARLIELCRCGAGAKMQVSATSYAVLDAGTLRLVPARCERLGEAALPRQGSLAWGDVEITAEAASGIFSEARGIGVYPAVCTLDAAALRGRALSVRPRRPGDRIFPTGLDGSKKIQDLFVDEKVAEELRDALPLVVCGDEVVWVPGYRISRHFAVPSGEAPSLRLTVRRFAPPCALELA